MGTPEARFDFNVGAANIERLVGVYHADGGIVGELRCVVGKLTESARPNANA